jgi:hypothetical protein
MYKQVGMTTKTADSLTIFACCPFHPQHDYSILLYRKGMGPKVSPRGVSN